ncbi:MAG: apolipoprotein N-acyltransferase [Casimicrobiaceae bacterium]
MKLARALPLAAAAAAGAITVLGFAPFGVAPLPVVTLAVLFALWQDAAPRAAAAQGFAFGVGLFGAGIAWIYIALETFGGMPTAIAVLATAGLAAYMALWPALAGYVAARMAPASTVGRAIAAASAWTLTEWLRGYVFTGFPWLTVGYAQLPGSALAGYAPLGGVFVVSLAVALIAAMVALAFDAVALGSRRCVILAAVVSVALLVGGSLANRIEWTAPEGKPLAVSLVQGNVAQALKFDPQFREKTFAIYAELVEQSRGRLIVLPESAYPMFSDEVPDAVIMHLIRTVGARRGDLLLGLFTAEAPAPGTSEPRYYNTVISLGESELQLYRKRHLVPFGETIPGKAVFGWFIRNVLAIPLADQTPGAAHQAPFAVAQTRVAVNICYEDAFGSELIDGARTAGFLVNVTNDAWYGRSIAAFQHNQIAAMRALELGRPMLRATNTGVTSAIAHTGRVIAELPWFTRGVLEVSIDGRTGATPYQVVGDVPALALPALLLALVAWTARRRVVGSPDIAHSLENRTMK